MKPVIRRARAEEAAPLRDLIVRSMAHWGHSPAYLNEARRLMSLSGADLDRDEAWVLTSGERTIGFYRISRQAGNAMEIEELHLEPAWIGKGLGRRLFEHAADRARRAGAQRLCWATDRFALGFYRAMGGAIVGTRPSGIAGDEPLLQMELRLDPADRV
jgi:GNAT superfamily N-acetyltransferase